MKNYMSKPEWFLLIAQIFKSWSLKWDQPGSLLYGLQTAESVKTFPQGLKAWNIWKLHNMG